MQPIMRRLSVCIALLAAASSAAASTYIDTAPLAVTEVVGRATLAEQLRDDLASGVYDKYDVTLRRRGGAEYKVTGAAFNALTTAQQDEIVARLMTYYDVATTYQATVDSQYNDLRSVPFFSHVGLETSRLPRTVPAENLLAGYARTWAYKRSLYDGPNCWHTSIASTTPRWSEHRYMNPDEFVCHLSHDYTQLYPSSLSELQYGDVVRLADSYGGEVHGFVYLGPDRNDPRKHIVFTKNGYARGYFLFMDYDTVTNYVYPGNRATFFRPRGYPIDPAVSSGSACEREYREGGFTFDPADPLIVAGLRAKSPRSLAPLTALP